MIIIISVPIRDSGIFPIPNCNWVMEKLRKNRF